MYKKLINTFLQQNIKLSSLFCAGGQRMGAFDAPGVVGM